MNRRAAVAAAATLVAGSGAVDVSTQQPASASLALTARTPVTGGRAAEARRDLALRRLRARGLAVVHAIEADARRKAKAEAERQAERAREAAQRAAAARALEARRAAAVRAPSIVSVPMSVWETIARCESGGDWHIQSGQWGGGVEMLQVTWETYRDPGWPAYVWQASEQQQIVAAQRCLDHLIASGMTAAEAWANGWPSCSLQLGLR